MTPAVLPTTAELVERLATHKTLGAAPRAELEWLAAHGEFRRYEAGEKAALKGAPAEEMIVMLTGHIVASLDRGTGRRHSLESFAGEISARLPYSRMTLMIGDIVVTEPSEVLALHKRFFPELIRECPCIVEIAVHVMLERSRVFTATSAQDDKMMSMGRLAAGLAHELNNPASAIARSASALASSLSDADCSSRLLGSSALTSEQSTAIEKLRDACLAQNAHVVLSPLEQEERERRIERWLTDQGLSTAPAEALADVGFTGDMLDQLARSIPRQALDASLGWIAANTAARRMAAEIQEGASRIHHLVDAVKGFTQMDRESVSEPVDISQGLANTLVVLRSKARDKAVSLKLDIAPNLPRVRGFAGELNQVWANLISNAVDAVSENGSVEVTARSECGGVVVRVIDNGPGIPQGIRDRIFDPFFTTKPVGEGSGLGLDIVRRLVQRHNGQIEVDSNPGRTEFRVILP